MKSLLLASALFSLSLASFAQGGLPGPLKVVDPCDISGYYEICTANGKEVTMTGLKIGQINKSTFDYSYGSVDVMGEMIYDKIVVNGNFNLDAEGIEVKAYCQSKVLFVESKNPTGEPNYSSVSTYVKKDNGLWDPLESTCRHASLSIL